MLEVIVAIPVTLALMFLSGYLIPAWIDAISAGGGSSKLADLVAAVGAIGLAGVAGRWALARLQPGAHLERAGVIQVVVVVFVVIVAASTGLMLIGRMS